MDFFNTIKKLVLACLLFVPMSVVAQAPIVINFVELKEDESWDGDKMCKVTFSITNVSAPGTIDRLRIKVKAVDDRGREVKTNAMQSHIANQGKWGDYTSIPVGQVMSPTDSVWFKEECKYIQGVAFDEVKTQDCAIRMLPEDAQCRTMIGWGQ